jgi:hypothetical protein
MDYGLTDSEMPALDGLNSFHNQIFFSWVRILEAEKDGRRL